MTGLRAGCAPRREARSGNGASSVRWRKQEDADARLRQRNSALDAGVRDLKHGVEAIEERVRYELGMIRQDEIFFQVVAAPPAEAPKR